MWRRVWLLVGLLLAVSLSCSLWPGSKASEDADEPGVAVTVESEEQNEAPVDGGSEAEDEPEDGFSFDEASLDSLSSYQATMAWRVEKEDGTVESFSFEQAATREPPAKHMTMVSDDETVELIQIGGDTWMRLGEEWIATSSDEVSADDFGEVLHTGDAWVSGLGDDAYGYVGKETVNGLQTRHYRADDAEDWGMFLGLYGGEGQPKKGVADLWVADEPDIPDVVVRLVVEVEFEADDATGKMFLTQDTTDINVPITIEPPADVAVGGLPEGIPMYPDATEVTKFGTMTSFSAADDVATVNAFYEDALSAAGWEVEGEPTEMEDTVMSTWAKDGQTLTLMISSEDDGASSSVVVMLEGGE